MTEDDEYEVEEKIIQRAGILLMVYQQMNIGKWHVSEQNFMTFDSFGVKIQNRYFKTLVENLKSGPENL